MKLILASHNKNKIKEFREILKDTSIELLSLIDLEDFDEIEETGNTFLENAIIKAKKISIKYNLPAIADDSGLEVMALNSRPGVYSARYSGKGDLENNLKVLNELVGITNREALFNSTIVLYYPNGEYYNFEGIWHGTIGNEIRGTNGFGYDTIFIPKGLKETVAELDSKIKSKISHRAIALQLFKKHYNI